ncbi:MAG: DUF4382 domain-containing protein [Bdellovibrionaceae bacterium]|nr:DUF4382 domain-containing protein [Pseudobdellovibrionaceae bacterium]
MKKNVSIRIKLAILLAISCAGTPHAANADSFLSNILRSIASIGSSKSKAPKELDLPFQKLKGSDSKSGRLKLICSSKKKRPPRGRPGKGPYDFESIFVTVTQVSAHSTKRGWQVVNSTRKTIDLLELSTDATDLFIDGQLEPGQYNMLRLKIAGDAQGVVNGKTVKIDIPLGAVTGIIMHGKFTVQTGYVTSLILDFDPDKSIHRAGKNRYWMIPVIKIRGVNEDIVAPVISIASPNPGLTNGSSQLVRIEYSDDQIDLNAFSVLINGIEERSRFQITQDFAEYSAVFPDGKYKVEAKISDMSGYHASSGPLEFTVDSTSPVIQIENSAAAVTSRTIQIAALIDDALSGVDPASVKVLLDSSPINNSISFSGGRLSATVNVPVDGEHVITATAKDFAGNESSSNYRFLVDASAPILTEVIPTSGTVFYTQTGQIEVKGKSSEALSSVIVAGQAANLAPDKLSFSLTIVRTASGHFRSKSTLRTFLVI